MVMCGAIMDGPKVKVGHYTDKQAVTDCTVILGVPVAEDVNRC
jgi:L-aminopeptidase/D-esterase-like protein